MANNQFLDANGLNYYNQQKQDKLPINDGSSSHRVWVATPMGRKDANGNKVVGVKITTAKYNELIEAGFIEGTDVLNVDGTYYWINPYYFKRINGYNGTNNTSSNGNTGIITYSNRQQKLDSGIIGDGGYDNYIEHEEPTTFSIMCRDDYGRAVVEDGVQPYHVINKKQLDKQEADILSACAPRNNSRISKFTEGTGWYRVAMLNASQASSNIIQLKVKGSNGYWTSCTLCLESNYSIADTSSAKFKPTITILSCNHRGSTVASKARIYHHKTSYNQKAYLDIYCNKASEIYIDILNNNNNNSNWQPQALTTATDISDYTSTETKINKYEHVVIEGTDNLNTDAFESNTIYYVI